MALRPSRTQKLNTSKTFDVLVIGAGGAGIAACEGAKAAGAKKIGLIEAGYIGGECPRYACVPTKALLASAKLYRRMMDDASEFGIDARRIRVNFKKIMKRKASVIEAIAGGERLEKFLTGMGVEVIKGKAVFEDAHTVRVHQRVCSAKAIVIATGSVDNLPAIHGIEDIEVLSYKDVIDLPRLPKSIAILGGGPVGAEFATFFSSLGVAVTMFERGEHMLSKEEPELVTLATAELKKRGVQVYLKTGVLGFSVDKKQTKITYQTGRRPRQYLWAEAVLIASGKKPNVEHLALERAKVKKDAMGKVVLNQKLQTSTRHIYLCGDVSGHLMFTHTAHYEGYLAGWNAAKPKEAQEVDLSVIPRVTFVDPELASVGLTLKEALQAGYEVDKYKSPLHVLARAAIDGRQTGLCTVLVDRKTGVILGAHMLGERAGEVIHELALAMRHGLPFRAVQGGIRAYPTYSEIISTLTL